MKSTMNYEKWDIVLVPFPFTNLKTNKKRPALIVSPNEYNKNPDVIVAFITSNLKSRFRLGDHKIIDWEGSNLPKPSMIRMKFATLDKTIILKKLGRLSVKDQELFIKKLIDFFMR